MADGINLENFVFFTYFLALIAIAVSLYTLYQLECIRENMNSKKREKRTPPPPFKKHSTAKGHFDGYR
jgi:hypothetical protein